MQCILLYAVTGQIVLPMMGVGGRKMVVPSLYLCRVLGLFYLDSESLVARGDVGSKSFLDVPTCVATAP